VNAIPGFGEGLGERVSTLPGGGSDPRELGARINKIAGSKDGKTNPRRHETRTSGRSRSLVKIQNGCAHLCTYCIVPRARGAERSLPRQDALDEVSRLAGEGFTEVVVTGVQLGAWGKDLPNRPGLPDLIRDMADRIKPGRLRLSSIEPWSVDEALIDAIAGHDRICSHIHVPLQSGDDAILAAMGRGYSARDYLEMIGRIRRRAPDIAVGTDVMAGFPGESESAFENTVSLLKQIGPSYLHAFPFSPRTGTAAAQYDGRLPKRTAKQRVQALRELGSKLSCEYRRGILGKTSEIVIERCGRREIRGLTDTFVPVVLDSAECRPRDLVMAKLVEILKDGRIRGTTCETAK
jgi:threonylcarbamoyladenosine tRNA methylthiotransferase MtaB